MRALALFVVPLSLTLASTAAALPIDGQSRGFREGANHHVGDRGFVEERGRAPGGADSEAARMHAHLVFVRRELAAAPPSRPELAAKRAQLLGYLDTYISHGATPQNRALPWRSPVFIDGSGAICAVGYLIERSAGRPLAETIAAVHRYDLLEDIAARMPEVASWIAESGFTLTELASIQPGYMAPVVETWKSWPASVTHVADGAYEVATDGGITRGAFRGGAMEGEWQRLDAAKHVVGSGRITAGRGTWKSAYPDGARMAEGPLVGNRPEGAWRFFHPSGNVAAEGAFTRGERNGGWRFFYDSKARAPIAEGSFHAGSIAGQWRHFDVSGGLLATSRAEVPARWDGTAHLLDVTPGDDGVRHWVHQGNLVGDHRRLDLYYDGVEQLYVRATDGVAFDADGNVVAEVGGGVQVSDCKWSARQRAAAHAGDVVTLHGMLARESGENARRCGDPRPVAAGRAGRLAALLASAARVRAPSPDFVRRLSLGDAPEAADLTKFLAAHMTWYIEWPHVDGRFIKVFQTLPGYAVVDPAA